MKLFCSGSSVLAIHGDDQSVDPSLYGENVDIVVVPDGYTLGRLGTLPDYWREGDPDPRPFARPVLSVEEDRAGLPHLSPRQMRLMMLALSMSDDDITTQIALIEDETERAGALIEWQWATKYERLHPLVVHLADAMEFDPLQFDSLWSYAANL